MAILVRAPGDAPVHTRKIGRNDPCPCGSGKKAKNCCGTEPRYFYLKKEQRFQREQPEK